MSKCLTFSKALFFIPLTVICVILFILHSLYFIWLYSENTLKTQISRSSMNQLPIPSIVICNRIPYNQGGISSVNSNLNQAYILQYLRQWLDPSFSQNGDFIPLSVAQQQQADQALQSTFVTGSRVQRLQQIMNQCQDVINSCTFAGQTISSYECCQFVQLYSGTLKGICWIFDNPTLAQADYDLSKGFQITFQVTRNSFYNSENLTVHPGIDVYLMNNSMDATRLATELTSPITIKDKENVRAKIRKQYTSHLHLSHCGTSSAAAADIDRQKTQSATPLALCLLMAAANECGCIPLWASFISLNFAKYSTLSQQINQTTACSVSTYDSCARKYMEYSQPDRWKEPPRPNANAVFVNAVKNCRSNPTVTHFSTSHTPCQSIEYPAEIERNSMPREFQTSSDYVSRLTIVYSSLEITNISEERDPNFYYLLSYIGYNAALWFAIGHIIWSVITTPCNWFCNNRHSRPRSSKVMPIINGGYVTPAEIGSQTLIIQRNQPLPPIHEDDNNSLKPPSINTEPDISRPVVILETNVTEAAHSPK